MTQVITKLNSAISFIVYLTQTSFNSTPYDTILDFSKALADNNLNVPKMSLIALKTLWEKEKMLVTSIFSFSHNVFNFSGS